MTQIDDTAVNKANHMQGTEMDHFRILGIGLEIACNRG